MANFDIQTRWFAESAPVNANEASASVGSGDNGVVTITVDEVGTEGNDYTIEVVEGSGVGVDLSATLTGTAIVVTLGTDGAGALDATKNTTTLIAGVVDSVNGVSAVASGTGATAFAAAVAEDAFTSGVYATEVIVPYTMLEDATYYYTNIVPNDSKGKNWRRFTLATY